MRQPGGGYFLLSLGETSHLYRVRTQARRTTSEIGKVEARAPGDAHREVGGPVEARQHVLRHTFTCAPPRAVIVSGTQAGLGVRTDYQDRKSYSGGYIGEERVGGPNPEQAAGS